MLILRALALAAVMGMDRQVRTVTSLEEVAAPLTPAFELGKPIGIELLPVACGTTPPRNNQPIPPEFLLHVLSLLQVHVGISPRAIEVLSLSVVFLVVLGSAKCSDTATVQNTGWGIGICSLDQACSVQFPPLCPPKNCTI